LVTPGWGPPGELDLSYSRNPLTTTHWSSPCHASPTAASASPLRSRSPPRRSHPRRRRPPRAPARTPHLEADPGTAATGATRSRTLDDQRDRRQWTYTRTVLGRRARSSPAGWAQVAWVDGVSPQRATGVRHERDSLRRRGATIEILVKDTPGRSPVGAQPVRLNLSLPDNLVVGWSSARRFAPSPRAG